MTENEMAKIVLDAACHTHRRLGTGLMESIHEVILAYAPGELSEIGRRETDYFLCDFAALRETFSVSVYTG